MNRKIAVALILLFALVLNASLFEKIFSTSKEYSISQGEITVYALRAVKNKYLNKSKLQAADLLTEGLNAIQEQLPETIINYDRNKGIVDVQIYNHKYTAQVKRMKDLYDIAYVLKQVYGFIEKNYKPEQPMEITDVEYIAINGILKKLDPHSYIFTPKEFEEFTSSTEGNFGGLGIMISVNDDGEITVVSPMDGTPAMKAGIEANDVIVQIDDESAINMSLNEAVERMRGKPDTEITLRIKRAGVPELLKFTMVRAVINIESVVKDMPSPGIGYIKLSGFMENTYPAMLSALDDLKKKGMKGLVLDMRNNSGGLLSQAIKISDIFLKQGVIVSTVGDEEKEVSDATVEDTDILDIPIVVMINEGTASAAEIVTAALKKNGRATVIGRKSFGKGSVQNLFRISGGGGLKLTIAQYLTPGDISIQSVGITPDIELRQAYISKAKISIFDDGDDILKEANLKEHIVSDYVPAVIEKPALTVRYFKEYKDIDQIIKERRQEKVGAFKNDEEIEIALKMLSNMTSSKLTAFDAASKLKEKEWDKILTKLSAAGIPWKKMVSLKQPSATSLKALLLSSSKLEGGKDLQLTFKAEYQGEIENLIGILETKIPYLKRVEVPFGTFSGSVERTVNVKLPESVPWRKESASFKLCLGSPDNVLKTEIIPIETVPSEKPEIVFSVLAVESQGKIDGRIQYGEKVKLILNMKNIGHGAMLDGRAMIINANNSKDMFINSGTMSLTLAPGETKSAEFKFELNNAPTDSKDPLKLVISAYDYKTKYSAGFTIPVSTSDAGCLFESRTDDIELEKDTVVYNSADLKEVYGKVAEKGNLKTNGKCGEVYQTADGMWVRSDAVKKPAGEVTKKPVITLNYPVSMPQIAFTTNPEVAADGRMNIDFSVKKADVKDVFVYLNEKKIFYERVDSTTGELKISLPVVFENMINEINVVVKGPDKEKNAIVRKFVLYPKGKVEEKSY
ncbi:MAG TPA: S41 family peptidase [bacterium]|nr:S41 family peptidase [bacterium]